jgi:IS5 family transposase
VAGQGAPALRTRLIAGLHYLKYAYGLSDEEVVERWRENPYWQYFCGEEYFQHELLCHPTSLTKWRQRLGEASCDQLLEETIDGAQRSKLVKPKSLERAIVDTTVQEKNVTFPTDAKLLDRAHKQLVMLSRQHDLVLR